MASSIPSARTALVAALHALTGNGEPLHAAKVARTGVWKEHRERRVVVVQNAIEISREAVRLGQRRFDEAYVIPVACAATRSGEDIQAVENDLWALVTAVEQAVLADTKLAGTVIRALPGGIPDGERSGPADDRSVFAEATLRVECLAHVDLA